MKLEEALRKAFDNVGMTFKRDVYDREVLMLFEKGSLSFYFNGKLDHSTINSADMAADWQQVIQMKEVPYKNAMFLLTQESKNIVHKFDTCDQANGLPQELRLQWTRTTSESLIEIRRTIYGKWYFEG